MRFDTWAEFLDYQRRQPYMRRISDSVSADRHVPDDRWDMSGPKPNVYPAPENVFRFTETPLAEVKVVILGQDPYHGRGQADGLAFSVREGVALPPSLRNIFKELDSDYFELVRQAVRKASGHVNRNGDYLHFDDVTGLPTLPTNGDLTPWTRQGVLLLNTALTVREGEAGSHCDIWQPFTDEVIRAVIRSSRYRPHFILWGRRAKEALERNVGWGTQKRLDIRHWTHVTTPSGVSYYRVGYVTSIDVPAPCTATYSAHPSPLSADKGFFGSRPFSRANLALTLNNPGCAPVDWRLS
jgi:uracil-DNA glycosylase